MIQIKEVLKVVSKDAILGNVYKDVFKLEYEINSYTVNKKNFISGFEVRYEINRDLNLVEVYGADALLDNLYQTKKRILNVIVLVKGDNEVNFFFDISLDFCFYIFTNGKIFGHHKPIVD